MSPTTGSDIPQTAHAMPFVTLYGPTDCPNCDRAIKSFLGKGLVEGTHFTKITIEPDDENYNYITQTLGYQTAPVVILEVDNRKIHWGGHRMDMLTGTNRLFTRWFAQNEEV